MSMTEVVMEGISPSTNPESAFDLFSLSSLDFWTSLDRPVEASRKHPAPSQPIVPVLQQEPATVTSDQLSKYPKRRSSQTDCKRRKTNKSTPPSQAVDFSALDCSDYWLRFDSDNDSIGQDPSVYKQETSVSQQTTPSQPSQSALGLIHPALTTKNPEQANPTSSNNAANTVFKPELWSPVSEFLDDSGLDYALSEEDENNNLILLPESQNLAKPSSNVKNVSPNDSAYSTPPLSWESPNAPLEQYFNSGFPVLNDPEQRKLFAIAMGCGQPYSQTGRPGSGLDLSIDPNQSPRIKTEASSGVIRKQSAAVRPGAAKRAASWEGNDPKGKDKGRTADRAAHNDIERKYRTNLKDRITELRDAIPSLRPASEDSTVDDEDATVTSAPPKVSKGVILSKATEYIHQLERRNRSLLQRNEELGRRLQAFEQLLSAGACPGNWQPTPSYPMATQFS